MITRQRLVPAAIRHGTPRPATESPLLRFERARHDNIGESQAGLLQRPIHRFVVRADERACFITARDVDWFESARNYVLLHVGEHVHRVRTTIQFLAEHLDGDEFQRIHKSTIVNLERIREVQPWFGGDFIACLRDGRQLRVSRTFARALLRPIQ